MRPVERGPVPETDGVPRTYSEYGDARDDLFARLGDYCSYCEMCCHEGPAVEHVQPKGGKSGHPELELAWDNFLLGCRYCNGVKGARPVALSDFLWPDQDNTFRAFKYEVDRAPQIAVGLTPIQRGMAGKTLRLTGLDREPTHPELSSKDRRWLKRREAWGIALQSFRNLQQSPSEEMRRQIVITSLGTGFWSVWMTVFAGDPDMERRFVASFAGTATDCFDAEMNPAPRVGGRI
jgi:hypothetical protein